MAEILREDPLQVFLNDTFERRMPTLDSVRETLLENDQHGILRSWRLPGLTLPEWDDDPVKGSSNTTLLIYSRCRRRLTLRTTRRSVRRTRLR
jgi:hypothetical protein